VAKGAGGEAGEGGRDVPAMFQKMSMNPNFSWNMSHYEASQPYDIEREERGRTVCGIMCSPFAQALMYNPVARIIKPMFCRVVGG
jgi:hypothetical protein